MLPPKTKQNNNRVYASPKTTPTQTFLKKNEAFASKHLLDKPKRMKPKFQMKNLVRTADLGKTFSKSDSTNYS